jgi:hypothetical protein
LLSRNVRREICASCDRWVAPLFGDCSACHSLLATGDPNFKALTELGITEPKR